MCRNFQNLGLLTCSMGRMRIYNLIGFLWELNAKKAPPKNKTKNVNHGSCLVFYLETPRMFSKWSYHYYNKFKTRIIKVVGWCIFCCFIPFRKVFLYFFESSWHFENKQISSQFLSLFLSDFFLQSYLEERLHVLPGGIFLEDRVCAFPHHVVYCLHDIKHFLESQRHTREAARNAQGRHPEKVSQIPSTRFQIFHFSLVLH